MLYPEATKKRDSDIGVFLWILRNCSEQFFYRACPGDSFCLLSYTFARNYDKKASSYLPYAQTALVGILQSSIS